MNTAHYAIPPPGIIPSSWRRYNVPAGLTVIQWVTDFSLRVQQLQNIATATQSGGARELKVTCFFSLSDPVSPKHTSFNICLYMITDVVCFDK